VDLKLDEVRARRTSSYVIYGFATLIFCPRRPVLLGLDSANGASGSFETIPHICLHSAQGGWIMEP